MVKGEVTDIDLYRGIRNLIIMYGDQISDDMKNFILDAAIKERDELATFDILMQAYDEIGALADNNIYEEFTHLLEANFGIDQDITEIGGGLFSRLGHRIAEKQTAGKVVVYDPKLVLKSHNLNNLHLKKECFGYDTDLEDSRMLIGISPCEATQAIIDKACKENLDFQISLCSCCIPRDIREYIYDADFDYSLRFFKKYLLDDIAKQVSDSSIGKLEIVQLEKCQSPLPVIYNKR